MHKMSCCGCGAKFKDEAYALLRVVTGFSFLYHGWSKVFGEMGVAGFTGMLNGLGVPFAALVSYLVAYGELLGGLALMIGVFTHWVSKMYIVIMLGAIILVHFQNGYNVMAGGYEYQLLLLVLGFFFLANGAGKYSLEAHHAAKHSSESDM
ncbi:MAG: DoxX family protein [Candidatus Pacebacteria bacterium]|nr:DoxX family protein [Candidatus Paceibacterota bacterium]